LDLIPQHKADHQDEQQQYGSEGHCRLGDSVRRDIRPDERKYILSDDYYVNRKGCNVQEDVEGDDVVDEVQSALEILVVVD